MKAKRTLLALKMPVRMLCILLALLFIVSSNALLLNNHKAYSSLTSGLVIDVYTEKGGKGIQNGGGRPDPFGGAFFPQENITLYAEVTNYGQPVFNKWVVFEIHSPFDDFVSMKQAATNMSGIATITFRTPWPDVNPEGMVFGNWSVLAETPAEVGSVSDVVIFEVGWIVNIVAVSTGTFLEDTYWIPRENFTKDEQIDVRVTLRNIDVLSHDGWLAVLLFDNSSMPVASYGSNFTVSERTTEVFFAQFFIPEYASLGKATTYANAFSSISGCIGVNYCPEKSAEIQLQAEVSDIAVPIISNIHHNPSLVQPYQETTITSTIIDYWTGVQEAILYYNTDSSATWVLVRMNKTTENTYVGAIPGFPKGTLVRYVVIAYDYTPNFAINDNTGQYYVYNIVPERASFIVISLAIIISTILLVVYKVHQHSQGKLPSIQGSK